MSSGVKTRRLKIILVVAAVLRLGLLAWAWQSPQRLQTPDSAGYIALAHTLSSDGAFRQDDLPEIFRTPGYPFFLVLGTVFGGSWWRFVLCLQIAIDVAAVYLTFLLGWMLHGERTGLWAAGFQAVSPLMIASSVRILSDTLFAFLLLLALLLIVFHLRSRANWPVAAAAAVLAVACYVRPVGLVPAGVCLVALLVGPGRLRRAGIYLGILLGLLGPWVVRNAVVADYLGFSSFAGDSLYFFAAGEIVSRQEQISPAKARERLVALDARANAGKTPGPAARWRAGYGRDLILSNPWLYATIHLRGLVGYWLPGASDVLEIAGVTAGNRGTVDVLHSRGLIAAVRHYFAGQTWAVLPAGPMVLVCLAQYLGVVFSLPRARLSMDGAVWLLIAVCGVLAILPGPFGLPRYRVPIAPLLSLAAAAGWLGLLRGRPAGQGPH